MTPESSRENGTATAGPDSRIGEYWDWVAVALFLLITVDLLTSIYAVAVVGIEHESNPVMVWLFTQPIAVLVGIHIVAATLVTLCFSLLFRLIRWSDQPSKRILHLMTQVYLGLLVSVGLFVFANNLSVIVLGGSLV